MSGVPHAPDRVPDSTSSGLVRGIQARDPEAWRRLVDFYSPLVYSWCRRRGLRPEDSADVLQDVFRAVARAIGDFRHDQPEATFRGWLRTIARSKISDFLRPRGESPEPVGGTEAQRRLAEQPAPASTTDGSISLGTWGGHLRRALPLVEAEFEPRTWRAFWLTTIDGRPAPEAAEQVGMTPHAVRQAKYKVLRRLRAVLGDIPPPGGDHEPPPTDTLL